jgi:hypothetical protein
MVSADWGSLISGTYEIFQDFGYTPAGGSSAVTDPNDFDPVGGSDWVIFQSDNFAAHPILNGVVEAEFLRSTWLSPATGAIITSDPNSTPASVPVLAARASAGGCVVLSGDSDWYDNEVPQQNAGYFKRDNDLLARQIVAWLNGCGRAPIARPGGPYVVNEGSSIPLNGSASSDPNGNPLTFAWDLDNDAQFDDAFIPNPTFSAALLDNGVYSVSLRVSDGAYVDIGRTAVTVLNVAPAVMLTPTATTVNVNTPATFTGSFFDPGVPDTHVLRWSFGDGSPFVFGSLVRSHIFTATGAYNVTLTVTDDDGGVGQATRPILVVSSAFTPTKTFLPMLARNYCAPSPVFSDIALTIDTSGSMQNPAYPGGPPKLAAVQAASVEFLNLLRFPGDQAAVVAFSEFGHIIHPLDDDRAGLIVAVQSLTADGVTRIDRAIIEVRGELNSSRHVPGHPRVMIMLSDGVPNGTNDERVLAEANIAKAEGIIIYTIGVGQDVHQGLLQAMATDPSYYYFSPSTNDLSAIMKRIAGDLVCA